MAYCMSNIIYICVSFEPQLNANNDFHMPGMVLLLNENYGVNLSFTFLCNNWQVTTYFYIPIRSSIINFTCY